MKEMEEHIKGKKCCKQQNQIFSELKPILLLRVARDKFFLTLKIVFFFFIVEKKLWNFKLKSSTAGSSDGKTSKNNLK